MPSKRDARNAVPDPQYAYLGLHQAAYSGNVGLVQYALSEGQPVDALWDGLSALHAAAAGGSEHVARLLIEKGADVNCPRQAMSEREMKTRAGSSSSPAIDASAPPHAAEALLNPGSTPLHFACAHNHPNVARLLLASGAAPHIPDKRGVTPLELLPPSTPTPTSTPSTSNAAASVPPSSVTTPNTSTTTTTTITAANAPSDALRAVIREYYENEKAKEKEFQKSHLKFHGKAAAILGFPREDDNATTGSSSASVPATTYPGGLTSIQSSSTSLSSSSAAPPSAASKRVPTKRSFEGLLSLSPKVKHVPVPLSSLSPSKGGGAGSSSSSLRKSPPPSPGKYSLGGMTAFSSPPPPLPSLSATTNGTASSPSPTAPTFDSGTVPHRSAPLPFATRSSSSSFSRPRSADGSGTQTQGPTGTTQTPHHHHTRTSTSPTSHAHTHSETLASAAYLHSAGNATAHVHSPPTRSATLSPLPAPPPRTKRSLLSLFSKKDDRGQDRGRQDKEKDKDKAKGRARSRPSFSGSMAIPFIGVSGIPPPPPPPPAPTLVSEKHNNQHQQLYGHHHHPHPHPQMIRTAPPERTTFVPAPEEVFADDIDDNEYEYEDDYGVEVRRRRGGLFDFDPHAEVEGDLVEGGDEGGSIGSEGEEGETISDEMALEGGGTTVHVGLGLLTMDGGIETVSPTSFLNSPPPPRSSRSPSMTTTTSTPPTSTFKSSFAIPFARSRINTPSTSTQPSPASSPPLRRPHPSFCANPSGGPIPAPGPGILRGGRGDGGNNINQTALINMKTSNNELRRSGSLRFETDSGVGLVDTVDEARRSHETFGEYHERGSNGSGGQRRRDRTLSGSGARASRKSGSLVRGAGVRAPRLSNEGGGGGGKSSPLVKKKSSMSLKEKPSVAGIRERGGSGSGSALASAISGNVSLREKSSKASLSGGCGNGGVGASHHRRSPPCAPIPPLPPLDASYTSDEEPDISPNLNIRTVSNHAEAEALVQRATKEILELGAVGAVGGESGISLTAHLAAYGETLQLERRFARGEAQRFKTSGGGKVVMGGALDPTVEGNEEVEHENKQKKEEEKQQRIRERMIWSQKTMDRYTKEVAGQKEKEKDNKCLMGIALERTTSLEKERDGGGSASSSLTKTTKRVRRPHTSDSVQSSASGNTPRFGHASTHSSGSNMLRIGGGGVASQTLRVFQRDAALRSESFDYDERARARRSDDWYIGTDRQQQTTDAAVTTDNFSEELELDDTSSTSPPPPSSSGGGASATAPPPPQLQLTLPRNSVPSQIGSSGPTTTSSFTLPIGGSQFMASTATVDELGQGRMLRQRFGGGLRSLFGKGTK